MTLTRQWMCDSQILIDFVESCDYDAVCGAAKFSDTALIEAVNLPSSGIASNFHELCCAIVGRDRPFSEQKKKTFSPRR